MPRRCNPECQPLCDFCKFFLGYYVYDYIENRAFFEGEGWCRLFAKQVDCHEDCPEFWCFNANGDE